MEWKQEYIPKSELDKKQNDYMKAAMDMAKRSQGMAKGETKKAYEEAPPKEHKKVYEEHPKKAFEEMPPKVLGQMAEKAVKESGKPPVVIERVAEKPVEAEKTARAERPGSVVIKKIIEKTVPVVVERVVEKPVVVEKIVEKPVVVEKIVEREAKPERPTEIHITNQSKKIEINADLDVNINSPLFTKKVKEAQRPELIEVEQIPEPMVSSAEYAQTEVVTEEVCGEELTSHPFENFKCECPKPMPERRCCRTSRPPNFNNFINDHNNNRRAGGFSWKDFKKN